MTDSDRPAERLTPRLTDIGLCGVLVEFSDHLTEPANRAALAFRARLESEGWDGVEETTTALTSVYIGFDPRHLDHAALHARLKTLLAAEDWARAPLPRRRRLWHIPAVFGGPRAPQLADAAEAAGLDPDAAAARLAGAHLRVMAIGFAPGHSYLGILPPEWDIPRQGALTRSVPAGALGLAVRQMVLFTAPGPTGWRHVGQCAFRGFRPDSDTPFPLAPGDEIRLKRIDEAALERIEAEDSTGNGGASCEDIA